MEYWNLIFAVFYQSPLTMNITLLNKQNPAVLYSDFRSFSDELKIELNFDPGNLFQIPYMTFYPTSTYTISLIFYYFWVIWLQTFQGLTLTSDTWSQKYFYHSKAHNITSYLTSFDTNSLYLV